MRWLVDFWQRLMQRQEEPPPPPVQLPRDPDLDVVHQEQHDLINQSGYAAERTRDSWNKRLRESWRPLNHDT